MFVWENKKDKTPYKIKAAMSRIRVLSKLSEVRIHNKTSVFFKNIDFRRV